MASRYRPGKKSMVRRRRAEGDVDQRPLVGRAAVERVAAHGGTRPRGSGATPSRAGVAGSSSAAGSSVKYGRASRRAAPGSGARPKRTRAARRAPSTMSGSMYSSLPCWEMPTQTDGTPTSSAASGPANSVISLMTTSGPHARHAARIAGEGRARVDAREDVAHDAPGGRDRRCSGRAPRRRSRRAPRPAGRRRPTAAGPRRGPSRPPRGERRRGRRRPRAGRHGRRGSAGRSDRPRPWSS